MAHARVQPQPAARHPCCPAIKAGLLPIRSALSPCLSRAPRQLVASSHAHGRWCGAPRLGDADLGQRTCPVVCATAAASRTRTASPHASLPSEGQHALQLQRIAEPGQSGTQYGLSDARLLMQRLKVQQTARPVYANANSARAAGGQRGWSAGLACGMSSSLGTLARWCTCTESSKVSIAATQPFRTTAKGAQQSMPSENLLVSLRLQVCARHPSPLLPRASEWPLPKRQLEGRRSTATNACCSMAHAGGKISCTRERGNTPYTMRASGHRSV